MGWRGTHPGHPAARPLRCPILPIQDGRQTLTSIPHASIGRTTPQSVKVAFANPYGTARHRAAHRPKARRKASKYAVPWQASGSR